jgi:GT2 family glycosyltransferase
VKIELSIVTVNYNGLKDTCELIDSIPCDDSIEIVVVDNGSATDEAAILEQQYSDANKTTLHKYHPNFRVIRSAKNLGFAGGNNLGIKATRGEYLYLVNNDTIFHPFVIDPLIKRLQSSPSIAIVCPKIRFAWSNYPIQFAGFTPLSKITLRNSSIGYGEKDHGQYDTPHPTPYAHGAAMMVSRKAIEKVGPLPECYFLYYEELDWSLMFARAGYEIWYEPAAVIYHKESRSTGNGSPLKTYYITRNRFIFAFRNFPFRSRIKTYGYLTFIVAIKDILSHLVHGKFTHCGAIFRGIRDFYIQTNNQI